MWIVLAHESPTGVLKVQAPAEAEKWQQIAATDDLDETSKMIEGRAGSFIVVNLVTGAIDATFAQRVQRVTV